MLLMLLEAEGEALSFWEGLCLLSRAVQVSPCTVQNVTLGFCSVPVFSPWSRWLKRRILKKYLRFFLENGYDRVYGSEQHCAYFEAAGLLPVAIPRGLTLPQAMQGIAALMSRYQGGLLSMGVISDGLNGPCEELLLFLSRFTPYLYVVTPEEGSAFSARLLERYGFSPVVSPNPPEAGLSLAIRLSGEKLPRALRRTPIFDLASEEGFPENAWCIRDLVYQVPADVAEAAPKMMAQQDFLRLLCHCGGKDLTQFPIEGFLGKQGVYSLRQVAKKLIA